MNSNDSIYGIGKVKHKLYEEDTMDYESIRDEWIHLRKIPFSKKAQIDFVKQAVLGLIVAKTYNLAKDQNASNLDDYLHQAIKSELKQTKDALAQGVDCQQQVDVLEALLPEMLSPEETSGLIITIASKYTNPNMGQIMRELKEIPNVDMKIASVMVKELL